MSIRRYQNFYKVRYWQYDARTRAPIGNERVVTVNADSITNAVLTIEKHYPASPITVRSAERVNDLVVLIDDGLDP